MQYSWLALYVSHKLAGMLPLSDSLTEHTLHPLNLFWSLDAVDTAPHSLFISYLVRPFSVFVICPYVLKVESL